MILVYAIAERRVGLDPPRQPLRVVTHGRLAGICELTAGRTEPTEEALWQHERVVQELMRDRAVLPMRFGSVLEDEAALRGLLREREEAFCAALDFVRGGVEVSVRARLGTSGAPPAAAASGRDYLAAKLDSRRSAERLAATLHDELAPFARASTFRAITRPEPELAAAYLVDRGRLDEFMLRAREFDARRPEAALACTGPWPPFSFAEPLDA